MEGFEDDFPFQRGGGYIIRPVTSQLVIHPDDSLSNQSSFTASLPKPPIQPSHPHASHHAESSSHHHHPHLSTIPSSRGLRSSGIHVGPNLVCGMEGNTSRLIQHSNGHLTWWVAVFSLKYWITLQWRSCKTSRLMFVVSHPSRKIFLRVLGCSPQY